MTTNQLESTKYSFWQLLDDHQLVIPRLQRDYVQGRTDSKTKSVREDFLDYLIEAVIDDGLSRNLDFIYGAEDENGSAISLLDGQQRLTTLYLLHWYLAIRAGKASEAQQKLKNFSYETRDSTRQFCEELVNVLSDQPQDIAIDTEEATSVSGWIKDRSWFDKRWECDPSVAGMLVMLDAIHLKLQDQDYAKLWEKLTREDNIALTFDFLPLHQFGKADELYLRMNARGRTLTVFELFKTWLQQQLGNAEIQGHPDWKTKLDTDWSDLFWKGTDKSKGLEGFDKAYLRFFKQAGLQYWVGDQWVTDIDEKERNDWTTKVHGDNYIPNKEYLAKGMFFPDPQSETKNKTGQLKRLFDLLEVLEGEKISEWDQLL